MTVYTEWRGQVLLVTLDRPERRNAVDHATLLALREAQAAAAADRARVEQARARLRSAGNSARSDQVAAAEQEVGAARAQLAQAQWKVDQKVQAAPVAALVSDVAYRAGEWVPAGAAIVTLLPPANVKARVSSTDSVLAQFRVASKGGVPMPNIPQMDSVWNDLGQAWVRSTKGSGSMAAAKSFKGAARSIAAKIG